MGVNVAGKLPEMAALIQCFLHEHFPSTVREHSQRQVIALAEEVGEFVGAYRRWSGQARRKGSLDDVGLELADVVITAFVTADVFGLDLDALIAAKYETILARGWREEAG